MQAATLICPICPDDPHDSCSDYCAMTFLAELPPFDCDLPACPCCGSVAQLVSVLIAA
jgi:hypothetical protein